MEINWKIFFSVWLCHKNELENNLLIFVFQRMRIKYDIKKLEDEIKKNLISWIISNKTNSN
jgi:hypothetical protein